MSRRKFFETHKPKASRYTYELALHLTADLTDGRVVDICCGNGAFTARVAQRMGQAIGVDFSTRFIGRAGPGALYVVGDAAAVPLAEGCADVVYCLECLQHIPDIDTALAEMARLLKPGGTLLLAVPNYLNPVGLKKALIERLTGRVWSPWLAHPVEAGLTYLDLRQRLAQHRFRVTRLHGKDYLLPWLGLLPRAIRTAELWPGKPWRSLNRLGERVSLPARLERSALAWLAIKLFVRAERLA